MTIPIEIAFDNNSLSLAEVLSSLSFALDMTSGQPVGHSQRTCIIGVRVAQELGLDDDAIGSLYHALLLKDSGCSSNAARMFEIFGCDEIAMKRESKVTDWTNLVDAAKYASAHTLPKASLLARTQRLFHIATHQKETASELYGSRCDRGAQVAMSIGLGENAALCIRHLDEHFDGNGAPNHLKGDQISLLGRIACFAQTLEVFAKTFDVSTAFQMASKRSGKWFDPEVVKAAKHFKSDEAFWSTVYGDASETVSALSYRTLTAHVTESRIDAVCDAFAQIVDAKSSFTWEHSSRVRQYAVQVGEDLGFSESRLKTLSRAALLHDIGKLAVPNSILDKPGKPTDEEWACIRRHPELTQQILSRISGFERITEIASAHHERLDGRGYYLGLTGADLDQDMRILAVADVFDALSADRPYRSAMTSPEVFAILDRDSGVALDAECVTAFRERYLNKTLAALGDTRHLRQTAA